MTASMSSSNVEERENSGGNKTAEFWGTADVLLDLLVALEMAFCVISSISKSSSKSDIDSLRRPTTMLPIMSSKLWSLDMVMVRLCLCNDPDTVDAVLW